MGHLPGSVFYASFACVVQDQGKMGYAEYKTALNTSAMCECSISYQNIAQIQQGTDVMAWAEDFANWSYLCLLAESVPGGEEQATHIMDPFRSAVSAPH